MKKAPKSNVVELASERRKRREQAGAERDGDAGQREPEQRGAGGKLIGFPKRGRGLWLFLSAFPHLAPVAIASEGLPDDGAGA